MKQKNVINNFLKNTIKALSLITLLFFYSCSEQNLPVAYHLNTFTEENWNYEQRILMFEHAIEKSDDPYQVIVELTINPNTFDLNNLDLTFSIYSPNSSESHRSGLFVFDDKAQKKENEDGSITYTLAIYPEKYFSISGIYKFNLLQKSGKADLFGVKSVAVKVEQKL